MRTTFPQSSRERVLTRNSLLGYWCTSYFVIIFTEHYLFRKGSFANYDLEGWNDPKRLPLGIAAFTAFALGVIAWVMGMVETWVRVVDFPILAFGLSR